MSAGPQGREIHAFDALTPDRIVDALADLGLAADGRITPLNSYENRVYLAHLDTPHEGHNAVVLKFYRPDRWSREQILEEHRFAAELAQAEVPVVAPLLVGGETLHPSAPFWFSVSPRRGGRAPDLDDAGTLEWIGRFLARLHTVGAVRAFEHRPRTDIERFIEQPRQWLLQHACVAPQAHERWCKALDAATALVASAFDRALATGPFEDKSCCQLLRVHGDCHVGNILWTPADQPGAGPHFVDLDDCASSFAVQDLWMLLSGDRAQRQIQLLDLVEGYQQVRSFDERELALIEPLRTLRLVHYSAWLARRATEPAFVQAFPWFGTAAYWDEQVVLLQEQAEAMQEPPLRIA